LEALLLELEGIERLEEQYRRVLLLLDNRDPQWAAELWRRLMSFYMTRFRNMKKARLAHEAVSCLNPDETPFELELFPDDD